MAGKRITLIMEFNTGIFFRKYVQGVTEEVEEFGGELTTFVAENNHLCHVRWTSCCKI
ncbi:hypothetical protein D3C74_95640 [compost metagenome]